MLSASLEYARRGDPVFPVWHVVGDRCGCRAFNCESPGKHPVASCAPHGFKDATTDEPTIIRCWSAFPHANIATRTGRTRTVVDIDAGKGGFETLARLEAEYGPIPTTAVVLTGGGGKHIHFAPVAGLGNSTGKIGPGIDVRGENGYVLLPPSNHVSGGVYVDDVMSPLYETPLAPMPTWLVALAQTSATSNGNGHHVTSDEAAGMLAGAPEGQRREVAAKLAGRYLAMLGPAREAEVLAIVLGFAAQCTPPFPEAEVRELVRDLAQRDRRRETAAPTPTPTPPADDAAIIPLGVGLDVFLGRTFPPVEAFVEGVLSSDGGGFVAGEEKLGKSLYVTHEGLCLATGNPVCGRFAVPQRRRVLLVEDEDSPRRVHSRIRAELRGLGLEPDDAAVRADLGEWFHVSVWDGFSFDSPAMVARLDAKLTAYAPAVCYLDVLRKMTAADLNKAAEAGAVLTVLDDLRRRHGVVFRLVHHFRKVQGFRAGRGSQEISGSFVLGAWAEQSLFFEPVGRTQGVVKVNVQSKDGAPVSPFSLKIESEGPRHAPTVIRLLAEDVKDTSESDEAVHQAVATLEASPAAHGSPGVAPARIALALKRSEKTIKRSLDRLLDADRVVVTGKTVKQGKLYAVKEA
jgi:hypothetical protein